LVVVTNKFNTTKGYLLDLNDLFNSMN
jgi:hypothetical protein